MSPCYEDHKWRVESAIRRRNIPRINMVKVLKVEIEEEEQNISSYWKVLMMMFGIQVIMTWLYNQCRKRRSEDKKCQEDSISEETINSEKAPSNSSEEYEEFELISSEGIEDKEEPKEKTINQSIFITRTGYAFHFSKECNHLNGRASYERTPCEDCAEKTKENLMKDNDKRNRRSTKVYITQRDKHYHDPSCEKVWNQRDKSERFKCLDCRWMKEDDEATTLRRRIKETVKEGEARSSTD
jgi:hypothetical protein